MSRFRDPHLRAGNARRVGVLAGITSLIAAGAVGLSAPAQADDSSTLTVVGTSDVFDSNLVQTVIKPGFEAYYKKTTGNDITLNYVSKGTGAAIAYARAGSASALIVHAASLENQFVADGYSAESYGRAIFFGDYVLLGPAGDPAGVLGAGGTTSHDIADAFQKIAAAGANHTARFVSRGGTPGTTVQEHAIWALTNGVPTCTVTAANGGGTTPSTESGTCPDSPKLPSWYKSTGLTQGPNVTNADACNYGSSDDGDSSNNDCYVFTDKGTFQYLRSQNSIKNLKIVAQDNSATAPGGSSLLINSFHAYAVNAAKFASNPGVQINSAGAQAFLNWQTSPEGQTAVSKFLADDPDGAPFLPSAAPAITYSSLPTTVPLGTTLTLRGTLRNVVPGTPTLSGVRVVLSSAPSATPTQVATVATTTTDANGAFAFTYKPDQSRIFTFSTAAIQKIENSALTPPFGDLLAPTSVTTPTVQVSTVVTKVTASDIAKPTKHVTVKGTLAPRAVTNVAYVNLFVRKSGARYYTDLGKRAVANGAVSFAAAYSVPAGSYLYFVRYTTPPRFVPGDSAVQSLTVR